jgi:uncharacterized protein (DUF2147 family)
MEANMTQLKSVKRNWEKDYIKKTDRRQERNYVVVEGTCGEVTRKMHKSNTYKGGRTVAHNGM